MGDNSVSQLGPNCTTGTCSAPVQISGLSNIAAVAAGSVHTLALAADGTLWAWGDNSSSQLGPSCTTGACGSPVQVTGPGPVIAVAGGTNHSLALAADGSVWAWGDNSSGQLGNGAPVATSTPTPTSTPPAGAPTGSTAPPSGTPTPTSTPTESSMRRVYNQAADTSTPTSTSVPTSASTPSSGSTPAAGSTPESSGTPTGISTPAQVLGISGAVAVTAGGDHSLALLSDGTVWAWGNNSSGELGPNCPTTACSTPVQVSSLSGGVAIAAGVNHSLMLASDGSVWAWGDDGGGQLGPGCTTDTCSTPVQVSRLGTVTAIAGGTNHSLALTADGTVLAWGDNASGQLGNGSTMSGSTPVPVTGLAGVTAIAAGGDHSLALASGGSVWAWGDNSSGQLGPGCTTGMCGTPVMLSGLGTIVAVAAGSDDSLAVDGSGSAAPAQAPPPSQPSEPSQ